MRRALYIIVFLLLFAAAAGAVFVLSTEQGLKWAFALIKDDMPAGLSIDRIGGRLIGPVKISGLTYTSDDYTVTAGPISLDWRPVRLLFLQLHLSYINASGIRLETRESGKPAGEGDGLPEIRLPVNIKVESLLVRDISVFSPGSEVPFIINEAVLKGGAGKEGVSIDRLSISAPDFALMLKGKVTTQGDYPLDIKTEWEVRPEGYSPLAGEGGLSGSMKVLKIRQAVSPPFNALLSADVYDVMNALRWEGDLSVSGLSLQEIDRSWPEIGVTARIQSTGSIDSYDFSMNADIIGPEVPQSSVVLSGTGTENGVIITSMSAGLLGGRMAGNGIVNWAPSLDWQVSLEAQSINPGLQWLEWPGKLDMKVQAKGGMKDDRQSVSIDQASVKGKLRGYPFSADAEFEMADNVYRLPRFEIASGKARLTASGSYDRELDARWNISVPDLSEVLPEGKGELHGQGKMSGDPESPKITAQVKGRRLSFAAYRAEGLSVYMDIHPEGRDKSVIDISADDVLAGKRKIEKIRLRADGKMASHTVSLSILAAQGSLNLAADAGYKDKVWEGSITGSKLDLRDFGVWKMKAPVWFSVSSNAARTDNICFINGTSSSCLQTSWSERDGLAARAGLSDIPLSLFTPLLPAGITLDGALEGNADISYIKDTLSGKAAVHVPAGSLSYTREKEEAVIIPFEKLRVDGVIDEKALQVNAGVSLRERGEIDGDINLPEISAQERPWKEQPVSGRIHAELRVLDLVTLFTNRVANTKGVINTDLNISGTLSSPAINGLMTLAEGGLDAPSLNIHVKDLHVDVKAAPEGELSADGRFTSGSGSVLVTGSADVKDPARVKAELHLKGENFEASNTPELRLIASPDITLRFRERNIHVEGALSIPEAYIEQPDLSDAVPVSDDVVIISESSEELPGDKWEITSRLELTLGDKVRFKGSGLSCRVTGRMHITEEPGKVTRAEGELQLMDGAYKAYGQDLKIEKGRFIFAGLMDDPGLDIRAVRQIKDVRAGILVTGTLKSPETRVFSVPSMDQSDALSYILFGRPMSGLSNSEGGQLYGVAASAGLSGGGFIAKKIGAVFGIEEVEIEKGDTLNESALVIGKYLSPRLYVSYGIGLFEPINTLRMRYHLSPRWLLQTEYGIESSGDVLYKLER